MVEEGIKSICDFCGEMIEVGRPRYIFKGELYCAYDGGKFDESTINTQTTIQDEMKRLIKAAEFKSEKELNDEVHYPFKLDVCRQCRDQVYEMIETQKLPDDPARGGS